MSAKAKMEIRAWASPQEGCTQQKNEHAMEMGRIAQRWSQEGASQIMEAAGNVLLASVIVKSYVWNGGGWEDSPRYRDTRWSETHTPTNPQPKGCYPGSRTITG
jgi:hypothetical protein